MYLSTSTEYFPEMYLSTFQVLYKLYLSTYVLKHKLLLPDSATWVLHHTSVTYNNHITIVLSNKMLLKELCPFICTRQVTRAAHKI